MKNIILIALIWFFLPTTTKAQQKARSFSIKSGHIEYKLSGNTTGTRSLWWDDYGKKSCIEENSVTIVKIMGIKNTDKRNMHTVMVDGNFWVADLNKNTGQKGNIEFYKDMIKFTEELTEAEIKELEKELLDSFGGERIGTGMVLGKMCEIISVMGAKSWIYKGLVLKSEVEMMGVENKEIAVSFKTNIKIPASKFKYLPNIKYEDISKYKQEMLESMKAYNNEKDVEDLKNTSLKYPFEKFKSAIKAFKYDKYKRLMVISKEGEYMATFLRGFKNTLVISASSIQDAEEKYRGIDEKFIYKGKSCKYGNPDDKAGSILLINYPNYGMTVAFVSTVYKSKDELLEISEKLKF